MTATRRFSRSAAFPPALAALLLLVAGCGDGGEVSPEDSASAIRDYYYTAWQEPSADWEVLKVRLDPDKTVTVQANIATDGLTQAIMERSRMEQMEIARMACPPLDADVWTNVGKKQAVGIALSGTAGHIINALCKTR